MAKAKEEKVILEKKGKARKKLAAGPCPAAQGAVQSNGGKTYTKYVCAKNRTEAKKEGYKQVKPDFKADLAAAVRGTVDCASHDCQGDGQRCVEKEPKYQGLRKVKGSESAKLAPPHNCEKKKEKRYEYKVRLQGTCIIGCECQRP